MAVNEVSRQYERVEFSALQGAIDVLLWNTHIADLVLSVPITLSVVLPDGGLEVFFDGFPTSQDLVDLDARVASFVVVELTREAIIHFVAGPVIASDDQDVLALDFTSPPVEEGKWLVSWTSSLQISAPAELTGARATVDVNGSQQIHHTDLFVPTAYNGTAMFDMTAGQTIRTRYYVAKVGAGAVDAGASAVRFSINKVG